MSSDRVTAILEQALAHHRQGKTADAEPLYRQALAESPNNPTAAQNLGLILREQGKLPEAVELMRRSMQTPGLPSNFHRNAATVYRVAGLPQESAAVLRKALDAFPDDARCWADFGVSLDLCGLLPDALAVYEKTLRLYEPIVAPNPAPPPATRPPDGDPLMELARAHYNRGSALGRMRRIDESMAEYDAAIALLPCFGEPHRNRAGIYFFRGQWKEAWAEYEWRWQCADYPGRPPGFSQPAWDGSDPAGKTVLLWSEQGLGDTIQFCRYAPLLKARGARVALVCQAPLKRLLTSLAGVDILAASGERALNFDLHASLMSLPHLFGSTRQSIPAWRAYLRPDPADAQAWRNQISREGRGLAVGLVWAGGTAHKGDQQRSIPLAELMPILSTPRVRFYSLQVGPAASQIQSLPPSVSPLIDHTTKLRDFADTAALIDALDLVISVDTAVAHAAGAIGKEVWTLLAYEPDFRWMSDSDHPSVWYPAMHHFRQSAPGAWRPVVHQIALELSIRAAAR